MEILVKKFLVEVNKTKRKHKGNVLVLTLIITNIILMFSLYIIARVGNLVLYNENLASYVLKEDKNLKQREYVLTQLNNLVMTNMQGITGQSNTIIGIDEFFKVYNNSTIVTYENCSIKYNSAKKEFLIETVIQDGSSVQSVLTEKFYIDISGGKPKYNFLKL